MGDDILRKVFDVVICGTSLGACITAAAAASCTPVDDDALAAGQPSTAAQPSILHLDALGFYGTDAACLSLTQVEQAAAAQAAEAMAGDRFAAQFMDAPPSPADDAPSARDAELGAWSSLGAARTSSRWPVMFHTNAPLPAELESQRRRTVVDLLPTLTLARGVAIDTLISSKVAEYLEFVLLNGSYMVTSTDEAHTPVFHQVPCSKTDVFATPMSVFEKRSLMKFLQFANDLRIEEVQKQDVARLNDQLLGAGRSLLRPQNKSKLEFHFDEFRKRPFREFLAHCSLPPVMQDMMMYAVAHVPTAQPAVGSGAAAAAAAATTATADAATAAVVNAEEGMLRLIEYLGAMGRYGNSPFVVARYGQGELCQGYSRACAVRGGTYMLQTDVTGWIGGDAAVVSTIEAEYAQASAAAAAATEAAATARREDVTRKCCDEGEHAGTAAERASDAPAPSDAPALPATPDLSALQRMDTLMPPLVATSGSGEVPAGRACDTLCALQTSNGHTIFARNFVVAPEYLRATAHDLAPTDVAYVIGAAVAVLAQPLMPAAAANSALEEDANPAAAKNLFSFTIAPNALGLHHPYVIYGLQQTAANAAISGKYGVLNLWTQVPVNTLTSEAPEPVPATRLRAAKLISQVAEMLIAGMHGNSVVWQSVFTTVAPTEAAMARDQLPRNVYVCPSQPPSGVRISSEADTLFAKRVMDALYPGSLWFEPRVDASAAGEGSAWADSTSDTDDASASQEADTNVASAAAPSDAAQVEPTHVVAYAPAPASAPAPAAEAAEAEFDIMAALAVLKADDEL